jgi:hypothetical protein
MGMNNLSIVNTSSSIWSWNIANLYQSLTFDTILGQIHVRELPNVTTYFIILILPSLSLLYFHLTRTLPEKILDVFLVSYTYF